MPRLPILVGQSCGAVPAGRGLQTLVSVACADRRHGTGSRGAGLPVDHLLYDFAGQPMTLVTVGARPRDGRGIEWVWTPERRATWGRWPLPRTKMGGKRTVVEHRGRSSQQFRSPICCPRLHHCSKSSQGVRTASPLGIENLNPMHHIAASASNRTNITAARTAAGDVPGKMGAITARSSPPVRTICRMTTAKFHDSRPHRPAEGPL